MSITVRSRRLSDATFKSLTAAAAVFDVTSRAPAPFVKFSPFYPHGDIPVPFSAPATAQSVEGVWQGLKVFEHAGIDRSKLSTTSMKGIKRSARTLGRVLGHQKGLDDTALLSYAEARATIYLPCYRWVLEHKLTAELQQLRDLAAARDLILLDYETNTDVSDLRKPLSHAGLIAAWLEDRWPLSSVAQP